MIDSAYEALGIEKRVSQKSWLNKLYKEAIDKRNELRKTTFQNSSNDVTDKYKKQRKTTHNILRKEKRQF